MSGVLTLNDVSRKPFHCKLQDLFFVYGVIDWAAHCIEAEMNDWENHAWYAAHHWALWSLK